MREQHMLGEITAEHFDATFGLNARGTRFTAQKALRPFNDGGSIFIIDSTASLSGFPGWSVYAASKVVQQAYARAWLAELKDRRTRVNALTSGQVATPSRRPCSTRRRSGSSNPSRADRWAAPRRSQRSRRSSPRTTRAT
jgi:NAD(P)-dependent dehydrogenase (short-subunit alcohol dehydrogenase family)